MQWLGPYDYLDVILKEDEEKKRGWKYKKERKWKIVPEERSEIQSTEGWAFIGGGNPSFVY